MNKCKRCGKTYWLSNDPLASYCATCHKNPDKEQLQELADNERTKEFHKKIKFYLNLAIILIFLYWIFGAVPK